MGFSTPKTPFNLADFLSQKGAPRTSRKPNWKRAPQAQAEDQNQPQDDRADAEDAAVNPAENDAE